MPSAYALCEDAEVIGAPFYVMERILGTPYRTAAELEQLGAERTRAISAGLMDTLAALHRVDLLLPDGATRRGDAIQANWTDLRDNENRPLTGQWIGAAQ